MPFDALPGLQFDALGRLGIVPVPEALVREHKAHVVKQFILGSPDRQIMYQLKHAVWRTVPLRRENLARRLGNPCHKFYTQDFTGAPAPLVKLALHVRDQIKTAQFFLEYFDTDPILRVLIDDQIAVLGIWDQGELVAIADWQRPSWSARMKTRFPRLAFLF
jgi:hypothetical protein